MSTAANDSIHVKEVHVYRLSDAAPMFGLEIHDTTGVTLHDLSWSNNFAMRAESIAVYVNPKIECNQPNLATAATVLFIAIAMGAVMGFLIRRNR